MRCPSCQTRVEADTTRCDCGHLLAVVPRRAPVGRSQVRAVVFEGDGSTLFGMHLLNLALTVATLGIYHFWAKVKIRQYVYGMTSFEGDRFAYHGLGKELLIGWLKVAGIFGVALGIGLFLEYGVKMEGGELVGKLLSTVIGFALLPAAIVGSQRYRLSRTSWRGIRFSFRGATLAFMRLWAVGGLATAFSLGLYMPFFQSNMRKFLTDGVYFGNERFRYDGEGKQLFGDFLVAYLLFIPTLGLYWWRYKARRERYYWSHTRFGGARFECTVTGWGLFKLALTNGLLVLFSGGLARPWAQVRNLSYMTQNLRLVGPLDVDHIEQQAQLAGAAGEGLTDFVETSFFDVELGL